MNRIPKAFLLIGFIVALLNVLGQIMMREKIDTPSKSISTDTVESAPVVPRADESIGLISFKQALRMPDLYVIAVAVSLFKIGPTTFGVNYKTYGQEFIKDDKFLNNIASAIAVLNIFTRFFWGWVVDKFTFKV